MSKSKNKKGFTLAEVLITLTIIGVIASLTIPSLIKSMDEALYKNQVKEMFSILSQATQQMFIDKGTFIGLFSSHTAMSNEYKTYLRASKTCALGSTEGCWHTANNWQALDGTLRDANDLPSLVLPNGWFVLFTWTSVDCSNGTNYCGQFYVDINGYKAPNTIGKDIHLFNVKQDTQAAHVSSACPTSVCEGSTGIYSGCGCAIKYLLNEL